MTEKVRMCSIGKAGKYWGQDINGPGKCYGEKDSEFSAHLKANYLGPQKHHGEDSRCERLAAMSPAPLMCSSTQKHLLCAPGWVLSSP